MAGISRRFNTMPDLATLQAIEGTVTVDQPPVGSPVSAGSGTACIVGEYEDGGFCTDPTTPVDLFHPAGGLRQIMASDRWAETVGTFGHTVNGARNKYPCAVRRLGEWWNGSAYIQAKDLSFRILYCARVDTSIGSVTLSPLAFLESANAGPFALATGQTLIYKVDGAGTVTATFTGVAATVTGVAGGFAVTAGMNFPLTIDQGSAITITFAASDVTVALVVAKINSLVGSTVASVSGGQVKLLSPTGGTNSQIIIGAGSTGTLAALGLTAATTAGSGNVANIGAVTAAEVKTIVELVAGKIRLPASGKVRLCTGTGGSGGSIQVTGGTALGLGFAGFVGAAAVTGTSGTTATSLPAGTVCSQFSVGAATRVVTMQTLAVPANTTVGITVKVRPAVDDGSYAGVAGAAIDTIETVPSASSEWLVTNASALTAALTEQQIDAAYLAAIAQTKGMSGKRRKINHIGSARQSILVRAAIRQNVLDSSQTGYGRRGFTSPPLGTTLATMTNGTTPPAVGANRDERVRFSPGFRKVVPEIAALGASLGGPGFTDSGVVEVHGDMVLMSLRSLLPPEENPAQATTLVPSTYIGVESALDGWDAPDYIAAKAAGICAPYFDENEGAQFMSGVTSVDPASFPGQYEQRRVDLADFLTDTMADFDRPYVKKLATQERTDLLLGKTHEFLQSMKNAERIADFDVNVGASPAKNVFVLNWKVEELDEFDTILNKVSIGAGVIPKSPITGSFTVA